MIASEFFPLDVSEFGTTITKIQEAKPDLLVTMLVGAAHVGFYKLWAASGMLPKVPILSYTFGLGNEQLLLPASDTDGIVAAYDYFQELDTPQNKSFLERFRKRSGTSAGYLNTLAADTYESAMIWAKAVEAAKSVERTEVIAALESGVAINGPGGVMKIDGRTHHAAHDMYLGRLKDMKWEIIKTWPGQTADEVSGQCDLIKNPKTNQAVSTEPLRSEAMDLVATLFLHALSAVATIALFSAGLAVIFGVMRVINLAHGEFMMLGGYAATLAGHAGLNLWLSMLVVATLFVGVFGLVIERRSD